MPVYVRFRGVEGRSTDAEHEKWIDVLSTDWGTNKPGTTLPTPGAVVLYRDSNA